MRMLVRFVCHHCATTMQLGGQVGGDFASKADYPKFGLSYKFINVRLQHIRFYAWEDDGRLFKRDEGSATGTDIGRHRANRISA